MFTLAVLLDLSDWSVEASDVESVENVVVVATKKMDEDDLDDWLCRNKAAIDKY